MKEFSSIIKFIYPYWRKYLKHELVLFLILAISLIISLFIPIQFQKTIDSIVEYMHINTFLGLLFLFGGMVICNIILSWVYSVYTAYVGESLIIDVTSKVYSSVLNQKRSFWLKFHPNDILTRFTQDILSIKAFIFEFIHTALLQFFTVAGMIIILFFMSEIIGAIVLCQILIIAFITFIGNNFLTKRSINLRKLASSFMEIFQKGILNPSLNFSWNLLGFHKKKYFSTAFRMKKEQVSFINQIQIVNQSITILNFLVGSILILFFLRDEFLKGFVTIGSLFAILMYSGRAIQISGELAQLFATTKLNRTSVIRIKEILEYYNNANFEMNPLVENVLHPFFKGELSDGIKLPTTERFIYFLRAGNGTGKSTYANILTGFDDLTNGTVKEKWFLVPSDPVVVPGTLL